MVTQTAVKGEKDAFGCTCRKQAELKTLIKPIKNTPLNFGPPKFNSPL